MFEFKTVEGQFALVWHGTGVNIIYSEIDGSEFYIVETRKKD
jgi:hypothetical protein